MVKPVFGCELGRLVSAGGHEYWVTEVGAGPVVVLLQDADRPCVRWSDRFVGLLVDSGRRVVRMDYRDAGRSSHVTAPYGLSDLARDVEAVLDVGGHASAHFVGHGMGAMIGQLLAMTSRARVVSLTAIGSSPAPGHPDLPDPSREFVDAMVEKLVETPPTSSTGLVDWLADREQLLTGTAYPVGAEQVRADCQRDIDWGWNPQSGHGAAIHEAPSRLELLGHVNAPTMVVHGTDDPVYPIAHAHALAGGIPGAVLVEAPGLGHEIPEQFLVELVPLLTRHFDASEALR